ncbi:MAG TPA: hypothetical protein VJ739_09145 [Gemmataceae bacterium]|nr:hypothetical protein [Gemmataceae bacterium]
MRRAATAIALLLLAGMVPRLPAEERPGPRPVWLDKVQTYFMLPVTPATAAKMNVSVNGAWAGIDSDGPVLPTTPSVRKKYGADVPAFVTDCRQAGLVVCGVSSPARRSPGAWKWRRPPRRIPVPSQSSARPRAW